MTPRGPARTFLGAALALALLACGRTVPHGGEPPVGAAPAPPTSRPAWAGPDLLPADLDLVIRVDLARIRANLGTEQSLELSRRAVRETAAEGILRQALERADTVWLGLRVADLAGGDRVLVVEAPQGTIQPDPVAWSTVDGPTAEVRSYEALVAPPRDGTARIVLLPDGTAAFVSPVEVDSVDRVLLEGPDVDRGQPAGRGLVSLDWRVRRPGVDLENRFPSLAALLRGIARVRATASMRANELLLEGRMGCRDDAAAARVLRFVQTIRRTADQIDRYRPLLGTLEIDRNGSTVTFRWSLPPDVVVQAIRGEAPAAAPDKKDARH